LRWNIYSDAEADADADAVDACVLVDTVAQTRLLLPALPPGWGCCRCLGRRHFGFDVVEDHAFLEVKLCAARVRGDIPAVDAVSRDMSSSLRFLNSIFSSCLLSSRRPPFVSLFVAGDRVEETSARHYVIDAGVFSIAATSAQTALAALLPIGREGESSNGGRKK
jgi:hypothetical protein